MRRMRAVTACGLVLCVSLATAGAARGEAPWQRLGLFKKVEADPNKDYALTEENGPWLIMAASFAGEGAKAQARDLVLELRRDYKLPAYLHQRRFDHRGGKVVGAGTDRYGDQPRIKYMYRKSEVTEEIAVLVGDYPAADDRQAEADLEKIKKSWPKSLDPVVLQKQGKETYQQLSSFRLSQKLADERQLQGTLNKMLGSDAGGYSVRNPTRAEGRGYMASAFLSRNPMAPKEQKGAPIIDKFVYDMNKDVKHSLLECKRTYTLKIATFTGGVVMDQKVIKELEEGKRQIKSRLEEAALKAHELTEALRLKGYEAYEFHDRGASIVCVGGFDSVGTPRADGKIEINPQAFQLMQIFGAKSSPTGAVQPQTVVGIPLDVQPLLIYVPRRSISADYAER